MPLQFSRRRAIAIAKNWNSPSWWQDKILRNMVFPALFSENPGTLVLSESWDNLIILDACRYDVFEEVVAERKLGGVLESRTSRGTNTGTFLLENFATGTHDDIVYVSGNPYVNYFVKDRFLRIVPVWKEGWSENHGTVLPQTVFDYTLNSLKRFPGRRFIVHFLQPHEPFLSVAFRVPRHPKPRPRPPYVYANGWYRYLPSLDPRTLRGLYKQNLLAAMPYVEKLLEVLPGRTVVTSDHGEALGEPINRIVQVRLYGHCPNARIPVLTKVPWFISEGGPGIQHWPGSAVPEGGGLPTEDVSVIRERLKALGYD